MSYENLKLEKGMYRESGASFTEVLEKLDPSENYKGTSLEGTDAFQRQLKRFDIHVKGAGSDSVEKFFSTLDSSVLFPEYISRAVKQGMEESDVLPKITATTTKIDALDYRSVYTDNSEENKSLAEVAEGASIPATAIKSKTNLIQLRKRGRMLVASYEAIRFQKLDLFSVTLRQIGANIRKMHLNDAVDVLLNGDGNNNAASVLSIGTAPMSGTSGTLSYKQLVEFWSQFDPYTMNTMLCGSGVMVDMLGLPELQNPQTGLNFQGTGVLSTPLGAELIRTSCVPEGKLIGLDRRYALEMVSAGDVNVEYDKIIDRQLERAAITSISGFGKIMNDAAKVLVI
ncbi:MAG: phage major capsid protein [Oscillospiraceae bacterium]|nr:phage major capsid protein [Oscillospiraceae bacterium]